MPNAVNQSPSPRARARRPLVSLLMIVAIAAACGARPARAEYGPPRDPWCGQRVARGDLVDVQVLVDGRAAPLFLAPGRWDRRYFQAFRGRHYALRIANRTGNRIGVVIAVDGLNVVSGERSRFGSDESMYVLDPWESATIRGWRTSLEQVRQFVFVDEERSYATRSGQANGDLGWIRVLAFDERRPLAWSEPPTIRRSHDERAEDRAAAPLRRDRAAAPEAKAAPAPDEARAQNEAPRASGAAKSLLGGMLPMAPAPESSPGTGWGERRRDVVRETWFLAAAAPTDQLVLRYEYASGLRALGIDLGGGRLEQRERGELGFAQPPRW